MYDIVMRHIRGAFVIIPSSTSTVKHAVDRNAFDFCQHDRWQTADQVAADRTQNNGSNRALDGMQLHNVIFRCGWTQ